MVKKKYGRMDRISKETAQKKFDQYYNTKHKGNEKKISNAKNQDIKYNKKSDKILYENEPGSARYLYEHGPRTFDFWGIDAFDEGTEINSYGQL